MTFEELRDMMAVYRRNADSEAAAEKDSHLVLDRLRSLYLKFDASEQAMANRVFAEWILSDDEGTRFDAIAMVDEFRICEASVALKRLAQRLTHSSKPGAPYEIEKANRIRAKLEQTT